MTTTTTPSATDQAAVRFADAIARKCPAPAITQGTHRVLRRLHLEYGHPARVSYRMNDCHIEWQDGTETHVPYRLDEDFAERVEASHT